MFLVINKGKVISYCIALCTVIALIAVSASIEKENTVQTTSAQNIVIENSVQNYINNSVSNNTELIE